MPAGLVAKAAPASTAGVVPQLLWATLIVIAVARLAWLGHYLFLVRGNLREGLSLPTSRLYGALSDAERQSVHEGVAVEVNRLADTSLVVGTLAVAAWTALFAVADQPPGKQISSPSRDLLLVGGAALILAPLLFRIPDTHLTFIGRRSGLFIGLSAVGLAFGSFAYDLLHGPAHVAIPLVIMITLAVRDLSDTAGELRLQGAAVARALGG
jgi:hypothetical protein